MDDQSMSQRLRLFLVDDHEMVLSGLRAELSEDFEIVGTATDAQSAIVGINELVPDVVLLDVHLPGGGGRTVLDGVADPARHVKFLALSVSDAAEDVLAVIRGGARGYVTKTIGATDLIAAIRRVNDGDAVFSPRLAGFVIDAFRNTVEIHDEELDLLTPREMDVLRLIARGFTYKQVAQNLTVSVKTVETHMSSVLRKLQLSSRHELALWATNRKLI